MYHCNSTIARINMYVLTYSNTIKEIEDHFYVNEETFLQRFLYITMGILMPLHNSMSRFIEKVKNYIDNE